MGGKICFIGVPMVRGGGHESIPGGVRGSALQKSAPGEIEGAWRVQVDNFFISKQGGGGQEGS